MKYLTLFPRVVSGPEVSPVSKRRGEHENEIIAVTPVHDGCLRRADIHLFHPLAGFPATSKKGPISPQFLIIDSAGNLYGMSSGGGAFGFGTVYKATPKGVLTVLHSFNGTDGNPDGSSIFPFAYANLTRDSKGNIYGATPLGGVLDTNCPAAGCGTVFKLTAGKTGTYTFSMLYSGPEGQYPQGVTLDSNGNLYVLGSNGGIEEFNGCCFGGGELFELSPSGLYSDLYDFDLSNGFDGAAPIGSLVATSSGLFFGITNLGGFVYNIDGAEGFRPVLRMNGASKTDGVAQSIISPTPKTMDSAS